MNSDQNKIKKLLKLETAKPMFVFTKYGDKTEWRLPDGTLHRDYGPAIEWESGDQEWYKHGKLHREDGPATVLIMNGKRNPDCEDYFLKGKHLSRIDFEKRRLIKENRNLRLQKIKNIINYFFKVFKK